MDALVSVHDVMPDTLDRVARIIDSMPPQCQQNLVLLVVPGLDWQSAQIDQLRQWQQSGYLLAGHGWTHHVEAFGGWYHRFHSLVLSRRAAEHLALNGQQIVDLVRANHAWFATHDLQSPDYYVPPAWALGPLKPSQIEALPFFYLELTSGLMCTRTREFQRLPLLGFEADNLLRQCLLTANNQMNLLLGKVRKPVRVSIHPYDDEYRLGRVLTDVLKKVDKNWHYSELFPTDSIP